jgi:hypothetical protein
LKEISDSTEATQGNILRKDDNCDRTDSLIPPEASSSIEIIAESIRPVVDVFENTASRPSTASSGNEESASPLSASLRIEEVHSIAGVVNTAANRSEPTLIEKLKISANSIPSSGGGDAVPRTKRKIDPQLLSSSVPALSTTPQPVPGGIHGMAW